MQVLICWSIELKQQMDIVRRLLQLLLDANISLKSHYGAIVTLITLGNETLDSYFWPIIDRYFPLLQEKQRSGTNQDILFVHGAIMVSNTIICKIFFAHFYHQKNYLIKKCARLHFYRQQVSICCQ